MKTLLIARPFAVHGGIERATEALVRALVERGHDVHLLTPGAQADVPGVTRHRLPVPPLPRAARVLALAALAGVVVRRRAWDVVQSHERTLCQDVYRAGEGCHRAYLTSEGAHAGRSTFHRVVLALERRVFAGTPRVVAIARRGKAEIETLYGVPPPRVHTVYNGVDLERFHPRLRETAGPAAREEAGVAAGAPVLLFVGSGFARKGLDTAIAALAGGEIGSAVLLVVGKGSAAAYRAQAERLGLAPRVRWLGPRGDVERWYAAADVVVLPTRYEPFGNVHLEALASGVPIVTTRCAGGAEVVEDGVTGAIVTPGDGAAVAAAVAKLLGGSRATLVAATRRAAEPFTWPAAAAGYERVWREATTARADFP